MSDVCVRVRYSGDGVGDGCSYKRNDFFEMVVGGIGFRDGLRVGLGFVFWRLRVVVYYFVICVLF